jgi:hypothetical protein
MNSTNHAMQQALADAGLTTPPDAPTQATPPDAPATLRKVPVPKLEVPAFTADNLQAWYEERQAKTGAAPGERRAIKVLIAMVAQVTADDLRKTLTEYADKAAKGTPDRKTRNARAAEIKALYGAWKFAPAQLPQDKGYHGTVDAARRILESMHLKYDGGALKDDARRKAEKMAGREADIERKARIAYHDAINRGATVADAEKAEQAARTGYSIEVDKGSAKTLANAIWKRHAKGGTVEGVQFIEYLCTALMDLMQQQAAMDKAKTMKKAEES